MEQQASTPIDIHEIALIAACMGDIIMNSLYFDGNNPGTKGYVVCLDIIAEWTMEFYNCFYTTDNTIGNWETFENSPANIYHSICWDDFLIEWTELRFNAFNDSGK